MSSGYVGHSGRVRPDAMSRALAIVHRAIATQLIRKAGFTSRTASSGTVMQVQKGGPSDLVYEDRGCERRVAPRRCKK